MTDKFGTHNPFDTPRSVWYWRMPTGIWLCSCRDGADMDATELETRVGGRSARAAKVVALELATKYDAAEVVKC